VKKVIDDNWLHRVPFEVTLRTGTALSFPMTWTQIIFDCVHYPVGIQKSGNSPIQLAGDHCVDSARVGIRPPPG
jgi:hypothetical protein